MKVKICGITRIKELNFCINNNVSFCGFILNYPKSHRNLSFQKAKKLLNTKRKKTKFVGVLVSPSNNELSKFSKLNLDFLQLYGNFEDKKILSIKKKYKIKIIKVIQVKTKKDVLLYKNFKNSADIILWDSSGYEKSIGWNFNWIKTIPKTITKMIAGNINIKNVAKLANLTDIVDVSGSLETNKVKDKIKIKKFLDRIKKINEKYKINN